MNKMIKSTLVVGVVAAGILLGYSLFPWLVTNVMTLLGLRLPPASAYTFVPMMQMVGLIVGSLIGFAVAIPVESYVKARAASAAAVPQEFIELVLTGAGTDDKGNPQQVVLFRRKVPAEKLSQFWSQKSPTLAMHIRKADGFWLKLIYAPDSLYREADTKARPVLASLRQGKHVLHAFETSGAGNFSTPEGSTISHCWFNLRYLGCEEEDRFATLRFKGNTEALRSVFLS